MKSVVYTWHTYFKNFKSMAMLWLSKITNGNDSESPCLMSSPIRFTILQILIQIFIINLNYNMHWYKLA